MIGFCTSLSPKLEHVRIGRLVLAGNMDISCCFFQKPFKQILLYFLPSICKKQSTNPGILRVALDQFWPNWDKSCLGKRPRQDHHRSLFSIISQLQRQSLVEKAGISRGGKSNKKIARLNRIQPCYTFRRLFHPNGGYDQASLTGFGFQLITGKDKSSSQIKFGNPNWSEIEGSFVDLLGQWFDQV